MRASPTASSLSALVDTSRWATEEETREIGKYLESGSADYDKLMSGDYILAAGNDIASEIYGWKVVFIILKILNVIIKMASPLMAPNILFAACP